jgi:ornithine carrier protein
VRASGISPELKANPEKDMPLFGTVFCAMVAGAFTSFFLTPIELVKCKIQVPLDTSVAANARPGIPSIIGSIYRHQGIRGFWHGQLGTLIREVGGGVAWFGSYEFVKGQFKKFNTTSLGPTTDEDLTIAQRMISGAAAGAAYNLAFYPADTIKSRMQTENVQRSAGGISTFSSVGRSLWAQHGLKGMYRGCGITVARSVPSSAFIFTVYEELKSQLPKRDDDD